MPFDIFREEHGSYKKFSGFITAAEFLQSIFENQSHVDYAHLTYTINDFLGVRGHSIGHSNVALASLIGLKAKTVNPSIVVAVVSTDPDILDLVKIFSEKTNYKLECFSSVEDARRWVASGA